MAFNIQTAHPLRRRATRFGAAACFTILIRWLSLALLMSPFGGCRQEASGKYEISGAVTLDGAPLDKGGIRFTALDGSPVIAGAMIRNGEYLIPAAKGLPPGVFRVTINSADEKAPPIMIYGTPTAPNRIPEEFNLKSDKQVEVSAAGENVFRFDIKSVKSSTK